MYYGEYSKLKFDGLKIDNGNHYILIHNYYTYGNKEEKPKKIRFVLFNKLGEKIETPFFKKEQVFDFLKEVKKNKIHRITTKKQYKKAQKKLENLLKKDNEDNIYINRLINTILVYKFNQKKVIHRTKKKAFLK